MEKMYQQFIEAKTIAAPKEGLSIAMDEISTVLFPHQRDSVYWALNGGRRAIFASFGLGKTLMQLEICRLSIAKKGGKSLIVCPLGVKGEFKKDARLLGMEIAYVRNQAEVETATTPFLITNYERVRDGDIDPNAFTVCSLDEASVLRGYGTKTYQSFLTLFSQVPYRFVCTATPSPNRHKELIHYAGFLGVLDTGQALTRFFKRNSEKAGDLQIHPHKEKEFWLWMSTWALFLTTPSDLGYADDGYVLPELKIHWHRLATDVPEHTDRNGQMMLVKDIAKDLSTAAKEKRETAQLRYEKAKEIMALDPDAHYLLWHHLEREREIIEKDNKNKADVKTVYGSQPEAAKEQLLTDFAEGKYRVLASKPEIAGSGCNFQRHCHKAIFMGIDYKFNDLIQSVHRIHRFGQTKPCEVHILYTDAEDNIRKELEAKWVRHKETVAEMTAIVQEYGLSQTNALSEMKRSVHETRQVETGANWTAVHNDCVKETAQMAENSMDLILTSVPFSNHYEYTPSYNDFGHTDSDEHFFAQMDYLTPELLRILKPGRIAAIHVKDRILFGGVTGYGMPTVNPFHAKTIFHYIKHGFALIGMITIEADVVRENNQTYRLGWTEQCKDGTKMGVGSPEYLLLFRKLPTDTSKAYADDPVRKDKSDYTRGQWQIDARAKWNSSGNRLLTPDEIAGLGVQRVGEMYQQRMEEAVYNYENHVKLANAMDAAGRLPATFELLRVPARSEYVWDDIVRMRTLNAQQTQNREQNHICPLQLDIAERVIRRYSNEGETVFDPFGGIMTVPFVAVNMNRKGYGVELNPDYWRCGLRYLKEAELKKQQLTLFDVI